MKTFVLFGLLLIPLINGKYLLVQVDDNQPNNLGPTGKDNPMTRCALPLVPMLTMIRRLSEVFRFNALQILRQFHMILAMVVTAGMDA